MKGGSLQLRPRLRLGLQADRLRLPAWAISCLFALLFAPVARAQSNYTVSFNVSSLTVNESDNYAKLDVSVSAGTGSDVVTVQYATFDGTAKSPDDYQYTSGTLFFMGKVTTNSINIPIVKHYTTLLDRTFQVALSNPYNATLGAIKSCTVTITQSGNPPPPPPPGCTVQFSSGSYSVPRTGGSADIFVTLSPASNDVVTVQFATADGPAPNGATAGQDYMTTNTTVTFNPGQTSASVKIPVMDDGYHGGDETVSLSLSSPTNANLGTPSTATLTITDQRQPPPTVTVQFTMMNYSVSEKDGTATIGVSLSNISSDVVTVHYATSDGPAPNGAVAGVDYDTAQGDLTFNPGDTYASFTVSVIDDQIYEGNKTVHLALTSPSGANLGAPSTATLTITDDEQPPPPDLKVTATSSNAMPNPVPVNVQTTANLTASASNVPSGTSGCMVGAPDWSWTYGPVEFWDEDSSSWGAPPGGAEATVSIDDPPSSNPSFTTLRIQSNKGGYWRVTGLKATVTYHDSCGHSWSASGTAANVQVTVVSATISPDPIWVAVADTAPATVTITPTGAASSVSIQVMDPGIASVSGSPPNMVIAGVWPGKTQLLVKLSMWTLASAEIDVVGVSYSPSIGPALTEVVFTASPPGSGFLSSGSIVEIIGTFTPDGWQGEPMAISHSGAKVKFDPAMPDQIAIAAADVFPGSFLSNFDNNPGIAMGLIGQFQGTATVHSGTHKVKISASFQFTESAKIGTMQDGTFMVASPIPVYTATLADLQDLDPSGYLYGRLERPLNDFTANPPATLSARVQCFDSAGNTVGSAASVSLNLVAPGPGQLVYQTSRPFVFVDNLSLEGDYGDFIAIYGDASGSAVIIHLPP